MAVIRYLIVVSNNNAKVIKEVVSLGPAGPADKMMFKAVGDITPGSTPAIMFGSSCPFTSKSDPKPNTVFKFDPLVAYAVDTPMPVGSDLFPFTCGEVNALENFSSWGGGGNGRDP